MKTHVVIDGNAFYEVDEECLNRKKEKDQNKLEKQQRTQMIQERIRSENISKK